MCVAVHNTIPEFCVGTYIYVYYFVMSGWYVLRVCDIWQSLGSWLLRYIYILIIINTHNVHVCECE